MPTVDLSRAIYEATGNPLDYPSAMPEMPVLVSGQTWEPLTAGLGWRSFALADGTDVDELLARSGAAPVAERIAQVAFGAHRNVANIAWKFARHARETGRPAHPFLIVPAQLDDADVVACNVSSGGHVYSGLLTTRPDLPFRRSLLGTRCPVALLLLDREQTQAMHDMAGIPRPGAEPASLRCDLVGMTARLDDTRSCAAVAYGVAVPFLAMDGRPVGFSAVATSGRSHPALSQAEIFRTIAARLGFAPEQDGEIPIADGFNRRRRALMAEGHEAARRIPADPVFVSVRDRLASEFALRDEDGRVRRGFEGVLPPILGEEAWHGLPTYAPRRGP